MTAVAIEQLLVNDVIKWDGELTELGKFVSDPEPGEPELGYCGMANSTMFSLKP